VLWVSSAAAEGHWLRAALADDRACEVDLTHVATSAAALRALRDEHFELLLVEHDRQSLDGPDFAAACRGAGHQEPLVILGQEPVAKLFVRARESGADDYICITQNTIRGLLWTLSRARDQRELLRENERLRQNEAQRRNAEQDLASRLLADQRAMLVNLESGAQTSGPLLGEFLNANQQRRAEHKSRADGVTNSAAELTESSVCTASLAATRPVSKRRGKLGLVESQTQPQELAPACETHVRAAHPRSVIVVPACQIPPRFRASYQELLRAYVIMGSGTLSREIQAFVDELGPARVSARQIVKFHLEVVEEMARGMGQRSARHLLCRADLLILELLITLADAYHDRSAPAARAA
jgi:hypothetical protein